MKFHRVAILVAALDDTYRACKDEFQRKPSRRFIEKLGEAMHATLFHDAEAEARIERAKHDKEAWR